MASKIAFVATVLFMVWLVGVIVGGVILGFATPLSDTHSTIIALCLGVVGLLYVLAFAVFLYPFVFNSEGESTDGSHR